MMSENYFFPVDAEDKFVPTCWFLRTFLYLGFTVEIDKNHIQQVVPLLTRFFWAFQYLDFQLRNRQNPPSVSRMVQNLRVEGSGSVNPPHSEFTVQEGTHCPFVTTKEIRWAAERSPYKKLPMLWCLAPRISLKISWSKLEWEITLCKGTTANCTNIIARACLQCCSLQATYANKQNSTYEMHTGLSSTCSWRRKEAMVN
jgi:hypothetical protein